MSVSTGVLTSLLAMTFAIPAPTQASGTGYVALGDSFSAGVGTRAPVDECYRSDVGYPVLIAQRQGLDLDYEACSGADIDDVLRQQVSALSDDTAYVTMTVGGNDLGYADVITECALPWWISDCYGSIEDAEAILAQTLPGRYDTLFAEIAQGAPQATVTIGGYPLLFNGRDCSWATFFSRRELTRINDATNDLDTLIDDRAAAYGFGFADPREAFDDHAVCDREPWVNNLTLPITESYHPNRAGNRAYADVFWPAAATDRSTQEHPQDAEPFAADDLRSQAEVVLAMDLTSEQNLARAAAAGVDPATVVGLERQLRSNSRREIARGLVGLHRLDTLGTGVPTKGRQHGGPVRD